MINDDNSNISLCHGSEGISCFAMILKEYNLLSLRHIADNQYAAMTGVGSLYDHHRVTMPSRCHDVA